MTVILFLDCEANGKTMKNKHGLYSKDIRYESTRLRQLAFEHVQFESNNTIETYNRFVKDNHSEIINILLKAIALSDRIVAHNYRFDRHLICSEMQRLQMYDDANILFNSNKWFDSRSLYNGTLSNWYISLFGSTFSAHDALRDVQALRKCYLYKK